MPVALGTPITTTASPPGTTQTRTVTPDSGANRVLFVSVGYRDTDADNCRITGVTSNTGGTFTEYAQVVEESSSADIGAALYYSTDFSNSAQTITVTYSSAPLQGHIAVFTGTGIRTSNPWRGVATVTDGSDISTSVSIAVPSAIGDLVLDVVNVGSIDTGAPTAAGSQSTVYNEASGGANMDTAASTLPGSAGNVTMSWSAATTEAWAQLGGSLVPAESANLLEGKLSGPMGRL